MRNFWMGVLVGAFVMYWYLVQGDFVRSMVADLWAEASSPPPSARKVVH